MAKGLDTRDLLKVARVQSREGRNTLAGALNEVCMRSGRVLNDRERELVYDIFDRLITDVEMHVRANLSRSLSDKDDAPKNLIMTLASDVIDVAEPVLMNSNVLEDSDLIDLILDQADQHQMVISQRENISAQVTSQLVETHNPKVISALLENESAEISETTMGKLVEKSTNDPQLQRSLVQRNDLSRDMAKRMYDSVGDALRLFLEDRFGDDDESLADALDEAVKSALDEDSFSSSPTQSFSFAADDGRYKPHPRMMIKALEENDGFKFEELFREATELAPISASRLIHDSGPEALAITCKATRMDADSFSQILLLLRGEDNPKAYKEGTEYQKTMDYFDRITIDGANRVLTAWREAPLDSW